jgi:putative transposase
MRNMGLFAIVPKKNTSKKNKAHSVYSYLLKGVNINYPNKVWGTDITYVRANGIWFHSVAVMDWYSRYVLSWKLSSTIDVEFCKDALNSALTMAITEYHNSDQGSQFTYEECIRILKNHEPIKISMDGRDRCFDNIFTERLWRSVK